VRLTFTIDDREVNGELWSFDRKLSKAEVQEIVECVFHDAYSVVQHAAHE
jgi:hypothetical protein